MAAKAYMNQQISMTIAGILSALIGLAGVTIAQDDIEKTITVLWVLGSLIWAAYGRIRHGDLKMGMFKK